MTLGTLMDLRIALGSKRNPAPASAARLVKAKAGYKTRRIFPIDKALQFAEENDPFTDDQSRTNSPIDRQVASVCKSNGSH